MKSVLALAGTVLVAAASVAMAAVRQAPSRPPDIHYTPTRQNVAEAMLALAGVGRADVVFDLGSGDGRLPILAAQLHGARGVGVEIDPKLVAIARANAKDAGVSDRVTFIEGDLFAADISTATVVTLYLSTSLMRQIEPKLKSELRPGARIVSHQFWFAGWPADRTVRVDASELFLWQIPDPYRLHGVGHD
ncbi:MAG TPA: methyltransferase domain-containing protein [Vicinamibacterales bacterium]|nr:methyltransferase domain-containing protein [Vicinamibacterales bacterium]